MFHVLLLIMLHETYFHFQIFEVYFQQVQLLLYLLVFLVLYFGLERTRLGAVVRAGVDAQEMAVALGLDIKMAYFLVFCVGCGLAGFAGVVAAAVLSVYPGMDMSVLILTLIVVVMGGPGSLRGAALGALLIGMLQTFGQVFVPALASIVVYMLMVGVLLLRPHGLLPIRAK